MTAISDFAGGGLTPSSCDETLHPELARQNVVEKALELQPRARADAFSKPVPGGRPHVAAAIRPRVFAVRLGMAGHRRVQQLHGFGDGLDTSQHTSELAPSGKPHASSDGRVRKERGSDPRETRGERVVHLLEGSKAVRVPFRRFLHGHLQRVNHLTIVAWRRFESDGHLEIAAGLNEEGSLGRHADFLCRRMMRSASLHEPQPRGSAARRSSDGWTSAICEV